MITKINKLIQGTRYMAGKLAEHHSMYGSEPQDDAAIAEALQAASELEKQITAPQEAPLNHDTFSERLCRCTKDC